MPDAKNNAKLTGDTHLPDAESDFDLQESNPEATDTSGTPADRGPKSESGEQGRPGPGGTKAGLLKDRDGR